MIIKIVFSKHLISFHVHAHKISSLQTYKILKCSTKDLQEEENRASPGRFAAAEQHVSKIIKHLPARQSSLSAILSPQARLVTQSNKRLGETL